VILGLYKLEISLFLIGQDDFLKIPHFFLHLEDRLLNFCCECFSYSVMVYFVETFLTKKSVSLNATVGNTVGFILQF